MITTDKVKEILAECERLEGYDGCGGAICPYGPDTIRELAQEVLNIRETRKRQSLRSPTVRELAQKVRNVRETQKDQSLRRPAGPDGPT